MGSNRHWYQVVDKDGKMIFEGTRKQVCDKFCIDDHYFYQLRTHNYAFKNQFYIKDSGLLADHKAPKELTPYQQMLLKEAEEKKRWNIHPPKEKKKTPFEQIKWHLDIYGNTIAYKDPKKIVEELEDMGYKIKVVHEPKRVIREKGTNYGEVFSECWIISKENK